MLCYHGLVSLHWCQAQAWTSLWEVYCLGRSFDFGCIWTSVHVLSWKIYQEFLILAKPSSYQSWIEWIPWERYSLQSNSLHVRVVSSLWVNLDPLILGLSLVHLYRYLINVSRSNLRKTELRSFRRCWELQPFSPPCIITPRILRKQHSIPMVPLLLSYPD